ncbi:glycosyltransferase [Smaragdicoccus niigatensis]|uniref:glycosyltransferase n=1 Tax=Smaragdicoccus niigatensis TaxID=359359 RepID=UPI0003743B4A|nr:glycosyltransferase [Smaragdicoccus niigatensis]
MKIALVSEHGSPIAAPINTTASSHNDHVAALSTALADLGHRVTIFTRRDDPQLPTVFHGSSYRVVHVPAGPPSHIPGDQLYAHMREFAAFLRSWWSAERPDVVHAHFWMSGMATCGAAEALGIPSVVTFHDLGAARKRFLGIDDHSPGARTRTEHFIAHHASAIIANCREEAAELARLGVSPTYASVIPNGVDTGMFTPVGDAAKSSKQRIVAVGDLVPVNGFDELVLALEDLPRTELALVGEPQEGGLKDDREVRRLRELAKSVGVDHRLTLLGRVPHSQLPDVLRSADVVACTPHYEPYGMVSLEAMACGRPMVAAAVGALKDTVRDGVTGFLVPPGNRNALTTALKKLLDDPTAAAGMGSAGRAMVTSHYRWHTIARRTAAVYAKAIERRRALAVG